MAWPIEGDYFETIQNPRSCFSDAELKAGEVATNPLGLPKSINGAFASVYQLKCRTGKKWAVRCFLRDISDQQRRYMAIRDKLNAAKLPYVVGFDYVTNGIHWNRQWYPILKMEWLEGLELDKYVEQNLSHPKNLQALIKQWIEMTAALRKVQVAHGDLQHGNILVCNGSFKLIDYDGMYVPALKGLHSNEQGHPNYQHPRRSGSDFNQNLDNFSAWLIFISLSAFAIEPNLWRTLNCGDDNLLFRRADLERPAASKVFHALDNSGKPQLQSLAAQLRSILCLPFSDIPALDGMALQPMNRQVIGAIPDWLTDHVPEERLESLALEHEVSAPAPLVAGAVWIFDHLVNELPLLPILSVTLVGLDRVVLTLSCSLVGGLALYAAEVSKAIPIVSFIIAGEAVSAFLFLAVRYRRLGISAERKTLFAKISEGHRAILHMETSVQTVSSERLRAMEPLSNLDQEYRSIPQKLNHALQELQRQLDRSLSDIAIGKNAFEQTELEELRRFERSAQKTRSDLLAQRNKLRTNEQNELGSMLSDRRRQYILKYLSMHPIREAEIKGIGIKLKEQLAMNGFLTAADIDSRIDSVRGIGQAKAGELYSWRASIEWYATQTAPSSVPEAEATQIKSRCAMALQSIEALIAASEVALAKQRDGVTEQYARERRKFVQQEEGIRRSVERQAEEVRSKYKIEKEQLAQRFRTEKAKTEAIRNEMDAKIVALSQSIFKRRSEVHDLQREYDRYRRATFGRYVRKVVGVRRVG